MSESAHEAQIEINLDNVTLEDLDDPERKLALTRYLIAKAAEMTDLQFYVYIMEWEGRRLREHRSPTQGVEALIESTPELGPKFENGDRLYDHFESRKDRTR